MPSKMIIRKVTKTEYAAELALMEKQRGIVGSYNVTAGKSGPVPIHLATVEGEFGAIEALKDNVVYTFLDNDRDYYIFYREHVRSGSQS